MSRPILIIVAALIGSAPANAERISDAGLGLTIEIPSDWSVLPTSAVNKDTRQFVKENPRWGDAVRNHSFVPKYLFGRSPNPDNPFAASVYLTTESAAPLKRASDQQSLLAFLAAREIPSATVVTNPEIVTLAGNPAGHMVLTLTLNAAGELVPASVETWVVRKGSYYLVLGASYHTDAATGDRAEVMQIVDSLHFTSPLHDPKS